jgi:hypothetical protein
MKSAGKLKGLMKLLYFVESNRDLGEFYIHPHTLHRRHAKRSASMQKKKSDYDCCFVPPWGVCGEDFLAEMAKKTTKITTKNGLISYLIPVTAWNQVSNNAYPDSIYINWLKENPGRF